MAKKQAAKKEPKKKAPAAKVVPSEQPAVSRSPSVPLPDRGEAAVRMRSLAPLIRRHNHLYYVEHAPEISDREFDHLFRELQDLEAAFPDLTDPDSPTRYVGSDLDTQFTKFKHTIPVLSLANTYSTQEALEWAGKARAAGAGIDFLVEWKVDGATLVLYYEAGRLRRAVTRGTGQVGDDVTQNAFTIRNIPHVLTEPVDVVVRGEVYMTWDDFDRFNEAEGFAYANPRNLAAGTLKQKKSRVVATRPLRWTAFDAYFSAQQPRTDHETLARARALGLPVNADTTLVPAEKLPDTIMLFSAMRDQTSLPVDGLVLKVNSLSAREELGFTATTPRWATALKFEPESGETTVRAIEVFTGRTGRVTPRAALEPVQLAGTTVSYATLHNEAYIKRLDVRVGSRVRVSKRGEIIPAVEEVLERGTGRPFHFPKNCPSCGTKLTREEGAADWLCQNPQCAEKLIAALEFFCGRKQMDINGLGEKVVRLLFEKGLVRHPEDLYRLHERRAELEQWEGFGARSVQLLLDGIEASRKREFRFVLPALGLRDIGPNVTELLLNEGYRDIDSILQLADSADALERLEAIDGIGPRTATLFVEQFREPEVRQRIAALRAAGLQFAVPEEHALPALPPTLAGQAWCVTGSFARFQPRERAMEEVKRRGGRVVSSVSSKTTHLLAGEGAGSKLSKARELGVAVVTEDEFVRLLGL